MLSSAIAITVFVQYSSGHKKRNASQGLACGWRWLAVAGDEFQLPYAKEPQVLCDLTAMCGLFEHFASTFTRNF